MRGNGEWFIFVTLRKPGRQLAFADNILAVDLGCKNIATTVNTANTRPNYYGRELRCIRGHYFNLRRKLGRKKASTK